MSLSINIGRPFLNDKTLDEQARSVLRLYGTNAHVYLPGANGVAVSGLPTNNYTLSNGSTGYSAVDGTTGLVLDAAGSVGAEQVDSPVNGSASGSWVVNTSGVTRNGSLPGQATVSVSSAATLPATKTYKVTFTTSGMSGDSIGFRIGGGTAYGPIASDGTYTYIVQGGGSINMVFIPWAGMLGQATINGMSVKEVTGIHATQSTTANKPALRRGLLNVLKQSNTFTDANWAKTNITPTAGVADPFGGTAATTLTATGVGEIYQTAADAGKPYTSGIYIRRRTGSGAVSIRNAANTAWIPLSLTSAWQLFVNDGGTTTANWYLDLQISTSGDAVDVYGAIVSPGVLSAQQIISEGLTLTTSTAASNSAAGRYSCQFDGANDSLLTGNLAITNAACITIAGRLDSLAATSVLFGEDTGGVSISVATNGSVSFDKLGTGALVTSSAGLIVAGTPFVLTCRLSGGTAVIRKNGTQSATSASGTTFSATTGARLGGTFAGASYCTGALSQIDVIVGAVTDADALTLERNAASNLVAGPTF